MSLTVTLPPSEYYDGDCQRNEENILPTQTGKPDA
ncbi:hypothetical protein ACHWWK_27285 [Klebsiella pneumoniae]